MILNLNSQVFWIVVRSLSWNFIRYNAYMQDGKKDRGLDFPGGIRIDG